MRQILSLAVLLTLLFSFASFSKEHLPVKLRYGENYLTIKIANETSSLLKTLTAHVNSKNLPDGITLSVPNSSVDVLPKEESLRDLRILIYVSNHSTPGNYIVPLILKDSLKNKWDYSLELELSASVVSKFELSQNYPNPFNGTTIIKYSIPHHGGVVTSHDLSVQLKIYDILGSEITTLVNEKQQAGAYDVTWNGKDDLGNPCASGIYFYKIKANNFQDVKKMIFLE